MKMSQFLLPVVASVALASAAHAGSLKVIANPSVASAEVTAEELKSIFLLTKTSLNDGTHVEPILVKSGPAHEAFLKEYLAKSDSALQTYYRSLVFTGKASMPKALSSDAEVVSYVARTKGAIGYVGAGANTAGVKTLDVK